MGFTENLLLAIGNAFVPGLGLFASIVSAISSDDRNAGGKFLFDIATGVLPSNFWVDLASGVIGDVIFESNIYKATDLITPKNTIVAPCNSCGSYVDKYVLSNGRILCSNCLSDELKSDIKSNSKICIYPQRIRTIHGKFIVANQIESRQIKSKFIAGRSM